MWRTWLSSHDTGIFGGLNRGAGKRPFRGGANRRKLLINQTGRMIGYLDPYRAPPH
jgi:hypothetical protein